MSFSKTAEQRRLAPIEAISMTRFRDISGTTRDRSDFPIIFPSSVRRRKPMICNRDENRENHYPRAEEHRLYISREYTSTHQPAATAEVVEIVAERKAKRTSQSTPALCVLAGVARDKLTICNRLVLSGVFYPPLVFSSQAQPTPFSYSFVTLYWPAHKVWQPHT